MLLNIVSTVVLSIMLGFLGTTAIRADDTLFDTSTASNVFSEDRFDATDDEDSKTNSQHLYSLDDEDDDFD